ncbi:hypothetical protein ACLB2K_065523 [Fragaria x ananassa]
MLSFKYERVVGFCRVCGLLEHLSQGCGSLPDVTKVQQISLVSVAEVERDILGFGRSPVIKKPNPRFRQGLGLDRPGSLEPSSCSGEPLLRWSSLGSESEFVIVAVGEYILYP